MQETATADKDTALAERIERLVDTFLTSDDDGKNAAVLSDARAIFERGGIPSLVEVGDSAAYGFVLIQLRVGRCVCSVALLKVRLTPSRLRQGQRVFR